MPDEIIHSYLYLFADDTKLFKAIHNITDCELLLEDLERAQDWTDQTHLELHPDKCKHMRIRPMNIPHTTFKYYLRTHHYIPQKKGYRSGNKPRPQLRQTHSGKDQ